MMCVQLSSEHLTSRPDKLQPSVKAAQAQGTPALGGILKSRVVVRCSTSPEEAGRPKPQEVSIVATTSEAYWQAKRDRADVVRENASRRMRGLEVLPLPDVPARPMIYEVYSGGEYQWAHLHDDEEGAREEAEAYGLQAATVKRVPAV
jgi:hypothetical protein